MFRRYRGSTDDLRRSREDINLPSLIPKLLSSRSKEERLKRQDSKDDIRHVSKFARRDSKEEAKSSSSSSSLVASPPPASKDEAGKCGIRILRRDNSREDVGRDSPNPFSTAKGKQQDKQERTEDRGVGGATRSKATSEHGKAKCEGDDKDANDAGVSSTWTLPLTSSKDQEVAIASIEQNETTPRNDFADSEIQNVEMIDVIVAQNRTQDERREQDTMVVGEMIDEKHLLAREPTDSTESDKQDDEEMRDTTERLLECSDGDVTGIVGERRSLLEIGYGKKLDEYQVVSEHGYSWA